MIERIKFWLRYVFVVPFRPHLIVFVRGKDEGNAIFAAMAKGSVIDMAMMVDAAMNEVSNNAPEAMAVLAGIHLKEMKEKLGNMKRTEHIKPSGGRH